jgi:hypothetical protein
LLIDVKSYFEQAAHSLEPLQPMENAKWQTSRCDAIVIVCAESPARFRRPPASASSATARTAKRLRASSNDRTFSTLPVARTFFRLPPCQVTFTADSDAVRCLRLSGKVLRWYADCCRIPIANTATDPRFPVVALIHSIIEVPPRT